MYAILRDKTLFGVCGFSSIDPVNQSAEFSIYVGTEYHGQGIAKCALKALVSHGFLNLNLNSIWGETFDGNHSKKVFEAAGFRLEGTLRESYFRQGRFINSHLYRILKKDWEAESHYKKQFEV